MDIEIDNQNPFHLAIGEQQMRRNRHVVEGAETRALPRRAWWLPPAVLQAMPPRQRQPRRHHRAGGGAAAREGLPVH
jgi:hypothetical protein